LPSIAPAPNESLEYPITLAPESQVTNHLYE